MAKFKIVDALASGAVSLYKTDEEDVYILTVIPVGDTKRFTIPFIKDEKGAIAYIDDTKYSVEDIIKLDEIVNSLFAKNVYKTAGVFKYTPFHRSAPAHSHNIIDYVKCVGGNQNKEARKFLKAEGYTFIEKELKSTFAKRDYSELLKNPEVKAMFDEDAAELKKVGATYESLSDEIKIAYETAEAGASGGIIFEGPTGTGKSFAARILANHAGAPLLNIQITSGTTVEDLIGMFVPCDDDSGAKWKFVMGPLLRAYVEGWQLVIEEINYGLPAVNAKCNEFTDDTTRVIVHGKVYQKHPNFFVYMTMNPGYEGTDSLNVALKNRFAKVNVTALSKPEFCKRLQEYSRRLGHELSFEFFSKLFDFAGFLEKEGTTSKWRENIKFSIRNAQRLCCSILQKKRNFEEFMAAMAIHYFNDLSCDNDNSEKLEAFKQDKEIKEQIKSIYESYDFAEVKTIECNKTWDDLFVEEEIPEDHDEKKEAMKRRLDSISGRFGLE